MIIYLPMKKITEALKEYLAARGEKWCPKCEWPLLYEAFCKDKYKIDGRASSCAICRFRYRAENKDHIKAYKAGWREEKKDLIKAYNARHYQENKSDYDKRNAGRTASNLEATPKWLTKEQHAEIGWHYRFAALLNSLFGAGAYHVDHTAPLKNDDICGLHVDWNLRVITAKENLAKGNKIIRELLE